MRISCPTNKAFLESLKSDANESRTLAAGYGDPALQVADSGRYGGARDVAYPVNRYVGFYQVPWCLVRSAWCLEKNNCEQSGMKPDWFWRHWQTITKVDSPEFGKKMVFALVSQLYTMSLVNAQQFYRAPYDNGVEHAQLFMTACID